MIDLHIHSTASDGSFTPTQIIALAKEKGVRALSITDHDTLDGVKELQKTVPNGDPEWIAGVEISCEPPDDFRALGSIHLLGYGFSIYDRKLNEILEKAKIARKNRNPMIVKKLNGLGFDITLEEVVERFGAEQTGRPHIAELLTEKGLVGTFDEAFEKYLGKDRPAYVKKYKVSCKDAIQIISDAGGIPVLAHPGLLDTKDTAHLERFIDTLIDYGLEGLEIYYTDHDEATKRILHRFAQEKQLLVTGGSDFHGTFNKGVDIGTGKDNLNISYSLFKALQARLEKIKDSENDLHILEENIAYRFKERSLLENALCHRSFLNENQDRCQSDNERLEFLGDAVLGLCIGHLLMERRPSKDEGSLSKSRSTLVSEPALAEMARQIDLGRFIFLGKGEALSRGYDKNSILSDAFEAMVAAVYLDGGFDIVYKMVENLFAREMEGVFTSEKTMDHKSALQELAQEKGGEPPQYELRKEMGPDHDKIFEVKLSLFDTEATGQGKTKKAAEQDAAKNALDLLKNNYKK